MPLHLLGKKSWNVYNTDNIEKVRRDEAAAKLREEEEERRMQEVDSERRIQLLRGLASEPAPAAASNVHDTVGQAASGRERKRRRIQGEDDTDRDIRCAKENSALAPADGEAQAAKSIRRPTSDAPLTDRNGHINLFPTEGSRHHVQKNPEAEAEAAKKKRELEDQYTMRFSNAAGFKQSLGKPWYSSSTKLGNVDDREEAGKDVWGNADKGRKEREKLRLDSSDPLASMKKGVVGLREVERARRLWKEERDREMIALIEHQRSQDRKGRALKEDPEFDDFSLDNPAPTPKPINKDHRHRHRSKKRDRSPEYSLHRTRRHAHHRRSEEDHRVERAKQKSHSGHHRSGSPALSTLEDEKTRLREERDWREMKERQKSAKLFEAMKEDAKPGWTRHSGGRYSSQFSHE
ncbi:MAG: hypothetical protein M1812_006247 [Candelaria pacifica]|nr:MAG: hypothetical protein M1812_006247 [Candelaria pacifica]